MALVCVWLALVTAATEDTAGPKFRSALRPTQWKGLTLPGQPSSTKQRRVHGAIHPHVVQMPRSLDGYNTYRVYLEVDSKHVKNIYARTKPLSPRRSFCLLTNVRLQCTGTTTPRCSSSWRAEPAHSTK